MVEGGGLENRFTSNRDGGSNPSPSAILFKARGLKFHRKVVELVRPIQAYGEVLEWLNRVAC